MTFNRFNMSNNYIQKSSIYFCRKRFIFDTTYNKCLWSYLMIIINYTLRKKCKNVSQSNTYMFTIKGYSNYIISYLHCDLSTLCYWAIVNGLRTLNQIMDLKLRFKWLRSAIMLKLKICPKNSMIYICNRYFMWELFNFC